MPSRGEWRLPAERLARGAALVALGALLWRAWQPPAPAAGSLQVDGGAALLAALDTATTRPLSALTLRLDTIPGGRERDWLRSIAAAGTSVRWTGDTALRRVVVAAEPLADPDRRTRLTSLTTPPATAAVRDAAGLVDSAAAGHAPVRVLDAALQGMITVHTAGAVAATAVRDSLVLRPVLVLARAGWEGKFTVAALEEAGWRVAARFAVAPGVEVTQGALGTIDTATYAAVIALDASVARWATAIARFAREGGGVIVAPEAARLPALAAIVPARAAGTISALPDGFATASPRSGLAATALSSLAPGAIVLERRGRAPVAVAARVALGRVLLLGLQETWRWRMAGGAGAPAAHRDWWSALTASVAYAPRATVAGPPTALDPAPYAGLVVALGAPDATAAGTTPIPRDVWTPLLFGIALAALLAEWASRRTRGAR